MRRLTWPQYTVLVAWLDLDLDRPSRTDQYLMQIAMEVRRVLSSRPNTIKLDQFRLRFEGSKRKDGAGTAVKAPESKRAWLAAMGAQVKMVHRDTGEVLGYVGRDRAGKDGRPANRGRQRVRPPAPAGRGPDRRNRRPAPAKDG